MRLAPFPMARSGRTLLLLALLFALTLQGCAAIRRSGREASPAATVATAADAAAPETARIVNAPESFEGDSLQMLRVGQEVVLGGCLRVAVLDFTDRSGPLDPADWATLRVYNGCDEPVRYLLVDLLLVDVLGRPYGGPVWVLERGEVLWPGHGKSERFAVPDPADHIPRGWAVRLRSLETPSSQQRATASRSRRR